MDRDNKIISLAGGEPGIDLDTVRETLSYMHDDMRHAPRLARVRQALSEALDEIAAVEARTSRLEALAPTRPPGHSLTHFVPWSKAD